MSQYEKRKIAVKVADWVNAIEGHPVSDTPQDDFFYWRKFLLKHLGSAPPSKYFKNDEKK